MAKRPPRDVLLRPTPDGEFQVLDVATEIPLATLRDRRAVDSYLAMHGLRVVATPAASRQAATHATAAPAAPGAAAPGPKPPCPTVRALRQGGTPCR